MSRRKITVQSVRATAAAGTGDKHRPAGSPDLGPPARPSGRALRRAAVAGLPGTLSPEWMMSEAPRLLPGAASTSRDVGVTIDAVWRGGGELRHSRDCGVRRDFGRFLGAFVASFSLRAPCSRPCGCVWTATLPPSPAVPLHPTPVGRVYGRDMRAENTLRVVSLRDPLILNFRLLSSTRNNDVFIRMLSFVSFLSRFSPSRKLCKIYSVV